MKTHGRGKAVALKMATKANPRVGRVREKYIIGMVGGGRLEAKECLARLHEGQPPSCSAIWLPRRVPSPGPPLAVKCMPF